MKNRFQSLPFKFNLQRYIASNYEDKTSSAGASASQFMRHEFIEGCVRVAVLVAREEAARTAGADADGNKGGFVDAGQAVKIYCGQYVERYVRDDVQHDANDFRTEFLYYEEVDACFTKHIAVLRAMYNAYRLREQGGALTSGMQLIQVINHQSSYHHASLYRFQQFSNATCTATARWGSAR